MESKNVLLLRAGVLAILMLSKSKGVSGDKVIITIANPPAIAFWSVSLYDSVTTDLSASSAAVGPAGTYIVTIPPALTYPLRAVLWVQEMIGTDAIGVWQSVYSGWDGWGAYSAAFVIPAAGSYAIDYENGLLI